MTLQPKFEISSLMTFPRNTKVLNSQLCLQKTYCAKNGLPL